MAETIANTFTKDRLAEFFAYLDELRESGVTNIGAGEYLARDHDLDARDARAVLIEWMQSFDRKKSPADRAAKVIGSWL
jgi:hypothetical protein